MTQPQGTLGQYGADVGHGFDGAVVALHRAIEHRRRALARRSEVHEVLKTHYARGQRRCGALELAMTEPKAPTLSTSVPSDVLRKANPGVWAGCRVRKPRLSITAPPAYMAGLVLPNLLAAPSGASLPATLEVRSMVLVTCRLAEAEVVRAREKVTDIAERIGWSGDKLKFADGWAVQLSTMVYDSGVLAQQYPEMFDALMVPTMRRGVSKLVVRGAPAGEDPYNEGE